jgi:hypothetical protein
MTLRHYRLPPIALCAGTSLPGQSAVSDATDPLAPTVCWSAYHAGSAQRPPME